MWRKKRLTPYRESNPDRWGRTHHFSQQSRSPYVLTSAITRMMETCVYSPQHWQVTFSACLQQQLLLCGRQAVIWFLRCETCQLKVIGFTAALCMLLCNLYLTSIFSLRLSERTVTYCRPKAGLYIKWFPNTVSKILLEMTYSLFIIVVT